MIFVDTNVIIDLLEPGSAWNDWSRRRIATADRMIADMIVVAETASRFDNLAAALSAFADLDIEIADYPLEAAFAAGSAFLRYRRGQEQRTKLLADFFIGAHAESLGLPLLTRDARLYRRYFPELTLITPEEDHG